VIIESNSREETYKVGIQLGKDAVSGQVYCIYGDLGVGKTIISQGVAAGLGITEVVNSPTFTIVKEYDEGRLPLYHFDVYRIGCSEEMYDIGFDEYINGEGVCIIEWANIIEDILPDDYLKIELKYKDMGREMTLIPYGEEYEKIVEELTK
jgi:tRNA threonylcarbamoyladenosine biosynthesis protein TsaE